MQERPGPCRAGGPSAPSGVDGQRWYGGEHGSLYHDADGSRLIRVEDDSTATHLAQLEEGRDFVRRKDGVRAPRRDAGRGKRRLRAPGREPGGGKGEVPSARWREGCAPRRGSRMIE